MNNIIWDLANEIAEKPLDNAYLSVLSKLPNPWDMLSQDLKEVYQASSFKDLDLLQKKLLRAYNTTIIYNNATELISAMYPHEHQKYSEAQDMWNDYNIQFKLSRGDYVRVDTPNGKEFGVVEDFDSYRLLLNTGYIYYSDIKSVSVLNSTYGTKAILKVLTKYQN